MNENKKVIIKAIDYRYPTRNELIDIYKSEPLLHNFGFPYVNSLAMLLDGESSTEEVNRGDQLYWWDHCLLNRIGSLTHAYRNSKVHYDRGIPNDTRQFEHEHYINRIQFDFYAETFYYFFSSVRDNIAQILNVYFYLGISEHAIHLNGEFLKKISNVNVVMSLKKFMSDTQKASEYRNSFAHRYPITHPDNRTKIEEINGRQVFYSTEGNFVRTDDIAESTVNSLLSLSTFLIELKEEIR